MSATIQEGYRAGAIGRIAQLHAIYYSASNGFGVEFEAKVASELGKFCESYKPGRDGLWLAVEQEIEGSIAIDGSNATDEGAHLRWFVTSDSLRGQGMGRQLLSRAVQFVDTCQYKRVYLWTFNGLLAARHLYESHGFRLAHESIGSQMGYAGFRAKVRARGLTHGSSGLAPFGCAGPSFHSGPGAAKWSEPLNLNVRPLPRHL